MSASTLTAARLRYLVHYDPDTGIFTRLISTSSSVKVGDKAGCFNRRGYVTFRIDNRLYQAHRLAWLYMIGEWPDRDIDHINGDGSDNRFANLRQATPFQNAGNARKRIDNKSGFKGVSWCKQNGRWQAHIRAGCNIYLGCFDTPEAAHAAYVAAAQRHFREFARAE